MASNVIILLLTMVQSLKGSVYPRLVKPSLCGPICLVASSKHLAKLEGGSQTLNIMLELILKVHGNEIIRKCMRFFSYM